MAAQPISPASAHINGALSDFASAYVNSEYIADELSPELLVDKESDDFHVRLRVDEAEIVDDVIGPRSMIPEVTYSTDTATYVCRGRGQKAVVPEALALNADPALDVRQLAVMRALNGVKRGRELRVANLIMTQSNWAASNTAAAANVWTDKVNGTPVDDIMAAMEAIPFNGGEELDIYGVCSDLVMHALQRHPQIKDLRGGGDATGGLVGGDELARHLGLTRILVSKIHRNTAKRGLTPSYSRIWGTTTFAIVVRPKVVTSTEAAMFSATFRANLPGSSKGIRVREWHDPAQGIGGCDNVAVELKDDEKVVQNDAGYLIRAVRS